MSVSVQTFVASHSETGAAVADLDRQVTARRVAPDCLFVFYDENHDDAAIASFLRSRFPGIPAIGGTSFRGVMTERGMAGNGSIGLLAVSDAEGSYGVAAGEFGDDAAATAQRLLYRALETADAAGELPELIWIYQSVGHEEAVLDGLRRVVGDRCPIIGGSAAVSDVTQTGRALGPDGPLTSGVAVAVLFPSRGVAVAYQGGYEPSGRTGVVTAASGRDIASIDGRPAADVYNDWLGGAIDDDVLTGGGPIGSLTAAAPLGIDAGSAGEVTYFRLVQPTAVTAARGLRTYADIAEGETVYAMRGSMQSLIRRAGRVIDTAKSELADARHGVMGGVVIYCAGCRIIVGDEIDNVVDTITEEFAGRPFVGCFTGGEQGPALNRNVHANLMISAVVFGR